MGIIGDHPETGIRIVLERPRDGGPPWRYAGFVFTRTGRTALRAEVDGEGAVSVTFDGDDGDAAAPPDRRGVAEKAKLLLRTAFKGTAGELGAAAAPPRRIVRWRPDK